MCYKQFLAWIVLVLIFLVHFHLNSLSKFGESLLNPQITVFYFINIGMRLKFGSILQVFLLSYNGPNLDNFFGNIML